MPSPFPGMDPYLEAFNQWRGVHHLLITTCLQQMQPELVARGYFGEVDERIYFADVDKIAYPDVVITPQIDAQIQRTAANPASVVDSPLVVPRWREEQKEPFLQIVSLESRKPITAIEVLSPTNKLSAEGRKQFRRKQREIRRSGMHLVEIDLLRTGRRLSQLSEAVLEQAGPFHYLVNIERYEARQYECYPLTLRDRLPRIPIPLKPGDGDVALDLQAAFDQAYDIGPYRIRVDYRKPPTPPLADDDALWVEQLLKEKGLR